MHILPTALPWANLPVRLRRVEWSALFSPKRAKNGARGAPIAAWSSLWQPFLSAKPTGRTITIFTVSKAVPSPETISNLNEKIDRGGTNFFQPSLPGLALPASPNPALGRGCSPGSQRTSGVPGYFHSPLTRLGLFGTPNCTLQAFPCSDTSPPLLPVGRRPQKIKKSN